MGADGLVSGRIMLAMGFSMVHFYAADFQCLLACGSCSTDVVRYQT